MKFKVGDFVRPTWEYTAYIPRDLGWDGIFEMGIITRAESEAELPYDVHWLVSDPNHNDFMSWNRAEDDLLLYCSSECVGW